jgi:hypothetical protein
MESSRSAFADSNVFHFSSTKTRSTIPEFIHIAFSEITGDGIVKGKKLDNLLRIAIE